MAHGRPDFELAVDIEAQSLAELNIDIVAQTLGTVNVNLAASAITLNVNLSASAITLNVNLSASAITLNINITSQTATVGLWLQAENAARTGTDKNFYTGALNQAFNAVVTATYIVPVGKTLYITGFGGGCAANAAASGDLNQMCAVAILSGATVLAAIGGNGGALAILSKPAVIPAGATFTLGTTSKSNHAVDIGCWANGYEV